MTLEPGQQLSRSASDNIELISEGFQRGETNNQIQTRIREVTGSGIRDTSLTEALRFLRGDDVRPPPDQRFTNLGKSPDPGRAPLSRGPILRRFSYNVGIVNTETGEIIGGVTVSSNTRRSILQIKAQATASIAAAGIEAYTEEDDIPDDFELNVLGSLEASETIL